MGLIALVLVIALIQTQLQRAPRVDPNDPVILMKLLEQAHEYVQWFYSGELDLLSESFSEPFKLLLPPAELKDFRERILAELGEETQIAGEEMLFAADHYRYNRIAAFSQYNGQVEIQIRLDLTGLVIGLTIQPIRQENH